MPPTQVTEEAIVDCILCFNEGAKERKKNTFIWKVKREERSLQKLAHVAGIKGEGKGKNRACESREHEGRGRLQGYC